MTTSSNSTNTHWTPEELHKIDEYIGQRIKHRRLILGIAQKVLGSTIDVSPQQIQKYENATNRVSASTLFAFTKILKTDIGHFYKGLQSYLITPNIPHIGEQSYDDDLSLNYALGEQPQQELIYNTGVDEDFSEREVIKIVLAYKKIKDPDTRKQFLKFLESVAK